MTINHTGWRDLKALAAAVIESALHEVTSAEACSECHRHEVDTVPRRHRRIPRLRECTMRWFESQDTTPGSLVWWCAFLDMPPERVRAAARKRIADYRAAQLKPVVSA